MSDVVLEVERELFLATEIIELSSWKLYTSRRNSFIALGYDCDVLVQAISLNKFGLPLEFLPPTVPTWC